MNTKTIVISFVTIFIGVGGLFITPLSLAQDSKEQLPQVSKRPSIEYKAEGLRDPFQGYVEEKKAEVSEPQKVEVSLPLPSLVVQGIIWKGSFPQVIINNKVLKIGDTIEGARIVDITKDGVSVLFGNQNYNLSTKKQEGGSNEK